LAIAFSDLLQALKRCAANLVRPPLATHDRKAPSTLVVAEPTPPLEPLRRIVLADEVSRTLFAEFAQHRQGDRGKEEIGWDLLGLRRGSEAVVLATLPAGTKRDAGSCHVLFDAETQGFASRVVRQGHRQLTMLGVVHTHPGSMRHPSSGDYRGDVQWVANLRGQEGIFGIGTADGSPDGVSRQPEVHRQCLGELGFSWYALGTNDRNYRAMPVEMTPGPDLALALRPIWDELEYHAARLDCLARQLNRVTFDVVMGSRKQALAMSIPLADGTRSLRVLMEGREIRYLVVTPDGPLAADYRDDRIDHAVFVLLAELTV